ncbi:hypothetical protein QAD02_019075 [Eretmocerus hayati]|uniref:Uncharacterized protein n=1 Tax=Eretmocerus hayati TaxID=131215 RepID=A0ACC2PJV1_9HYME|nr:hypothetical protein QAD02_019075 [Eretmocerus hayati]
MSSKHSPAKVTLGMIKGKPITMSVPVIRYHASDDELEELYPDTDDEKRLTPESDRISPRPSPARCRISITRERDKENGDGLEESLEKRSTSVDGPLFDGTPPSDRWKVLSDIKGKITKTFEEKLSEIKSERKKSKHDRSRDTSSVSDYEDLGDVTPTEETNSEKIEKEPSPILRKRSNSSRFVGFSYIKTGLKAKKSDEGIEDGVEAAESSYEYPPDKDIGKNGLVDSNETGPRSKFQTDLKCFLPGIFEPPNLALTECERFRLQLQHRIYYQLCMVMVALLICYCIPFSTYFTGICAGIFISVMMKKIYLNIDQLLTKSNDRIPILEISSVQEHAIVEKFEGWLNELPYKYEPACYHVARTKPVFFILESDVLQILETRSRIPKRAIWDEAKHKPRFTKKRVYCLAGAKVELLPSGLIRRRRWSKKYPICLTLESDTIKESTVIENSSDEEPLPLEPDSDRLVVEEEETDDDLSQSKDRDIYEDCRDETDDEETKMKMYIFARTDRQKEDWFRRLKAASEYGSKRSSISSTKDSTVSANSPTQTNGESKPVSPSMSASEMPSILPYHAYMARYTEDSVISDADTSSSSDISHDGIWINALFGRILFDMHKCPETINVIQDKIQRKLSNIRLPYFMESLSVSELVIGQGAPVIHKSSKPVMDDRGLWFDLDITYEGSLTMTIETKLNLMKLKRTNSTSCNSSDLLGVEKTPRSARSPMFDSDVEDSPETSTDDEDSIPLAAPPSSKENTPTSSGKKFLSMVDKLASNKYFQHATELSYVKRAMEGVSNTEIRLMVSVSSIEGCLSVNVPPPPSDRIWYGFKPIPKINLTAKPTVGERSFNIVYVTKWIETKLLREFEKIFVLPNMDDLMISMCPNYPFY